MTSVWERFDGIANAEEVNTAKNSFDPIPVGTYEATLELLEAGETKDGLPKLSGRFRLDTGRIAFYNQNLQNLNNPNMTAVNIAEAVKFLGALKGEEIEYVNLGKLESDMHEIPLGGKYKMSISYGAKDVDMKYPRFKVLSKVDDVVDNFDGSELPF